MNRLLLSTVIGLLTLASCGSSTASSNTPAASSSVEPEKGSAESPYTIEEGVEAIKSSANSYLDNVHFVATVSRNDGFFPYTDEELEKYQSFGIYKLPIYFNYEGKDISVNVSMQGYDDAERKELASQVGRNFDGYPDCLGGQEFVFLGDCGEENGRVWFSPSALVSMSVDKANPNPLTFKKLDYAYSKGGFLIRGENKGLIQAYGYDMGRQTFNANNNAKITKFLVTVNPGTTEITYEYMYGSNGYKTGTITVDSSYQAELELESPAKSLTISSSKAPYLTDLEVQTA